ncbi:2-thiocytidine tRNA biosynthesis protein TtcA [Carpediemonas membranifera]|uniref:2-thiocytidine tRNA biosynthesis protein TtcA n=1 Tax=Carpediemonas membranifera TaxID=201153 RepID=A0A8J6AY01_9EUKA|nr:2-thiocytidine tRNA biosynthesis protein TtcA [Carpediemonas membranifera]|eukprot:KAG9395240.1 2-thiocytidine tRNA biosynthesis protein TtcA [Carpediemonas membranifera]
MGCAICGGMAAIKYTADGRLLCKPCFFQSFEDAVLHTIEADSLFTPGQRVAIGVSGGKDSSVLTHVLFVLNERHSLGLDLHMVAIDEGIRGYRDDSLACVYRMQERYSLPLVVKSFKGLFGASLDDIDDRRAAPTPLCSECGVLRRYALLTGSREAGADVMALGHNADDAAESIVLNLMRADIARLGRGANTVTDGADIPRVKPMHRCTQRDIVMYAHLMRLDYFATECTYAPRGLRNVPRAILGAAGGVLSGVPLNIQRVGDVLSRALHEDSKPGVCERCGGMSSGRVCQTCLVVEAEGHRGVRLSGND